MPLREIARLIIEILRVEREYLTEHLTLHLVNNVLECVAVCERPFSCRMTMHIEEELESFCRLEVLR